MGCERVLRSDCVFTMGQHEACSLLIADTFRLPFIDACCCCFEPRSPPLCVTHIFSKKIHLLVVHRNANFWFESTSPSFIKLVQNPFHFSQFLKKLSDTKFKSSYREATEQFLRRNSSKIQIPKGHLRWILTLTLSQQS